MDLKNFDMKSFMENAQKAQKEMQEAYAEMTQKNKDRIFIGKSGGDLVEAHISMQMRLMKLNLNPKILEEKLEIIAQLVTAAINQGIQAAQEAVQQEMSKVTGKLSPDLLSVFK